ncbi:MAG: glutaminase, partial [Myxococcota bacterium]
MLNGRAQTISLREVLEELHQRFADRDEGAPASYIPELSRVDRTLFGISASDVQGALTCVGDDDVFFTIQSIAKVFVYGLALDLHGREAVRARVGVEPSGDAFDALINLDMSTKRPYNPMINAGAIAITSTIPGRDPTERLRCLLEMFSRYFGREVNISMPVFLSERLSGHRNRALAHLMNHFGMLEKDLEHTLDLYFQQCSVLVTTKDLAMAAATLANRGMNPLTGKQAIQPQY